MQTSRFHTLFVNPDEYTIALASKNTAVETLSDNYIEEWGEGLGSLSLSGGTGFAARMVSSSGGRRDGYTEYLALRDFIKRYLKLTKSNRNPASGDPRFVELRVHFWEDDEHFVITLEGPEAFKKRRSKSEPLLYGYSIQAKIVGEIRKEEISLEARGQVLAYQRMASAIKTLGEVGDSLTAWAASVTPGNPLYFAKQAIDAFNSDAARVGEHASSMMGAIRKAQAGLGLVDMAAALAADGVQLLQDTLIDQPAEFAIELTRPIRRGVCAAQNIANLDIVKGQVHSRVEDVKRAYSVEAPSC